MGAKISVLIGFSLIQKIIGGVSPKKQGFFKQDNLALYLKKKLKSSQYLARQGCRKPKSVTGNRLPLKACAGKIQ